MLVAMLRMVNRNISWAAPSKLPNAHVHNVHQPQHTTQRLPERIIEKAVYGMLPKGRLGNGIRLHLKTYKGPNHPHEAQQPVDITHKINQKPKAGQ